MWKIKMKKNKLHNIKATGFKTPDNYFESFDEKFFDKVSEIDVIYGIESPGFTVPKDYFTKVEDEILSHVIKEEAKPVYNLIPKTSFYYAIGIAASLVLMFSLFFNKSTLTIDGIDTATIENYLYQEDYSNDELALLFSGSNISETDFIDISISEETLNQYLDNTDTEDLIFE